MRPELLVVGHIAKDLVAGGWRPGGAVAYAGLACARLGVRTAVLTAADPDLPVADLLPGIDVRVVPSARTTTFENTYTPAGRTQRVTAVARRIRPAHLPPGWRHSLVTFAGPLIGEVDPALTARMSGFVAAGLQGWLRRRGPAGRVYPRDPREVILPEADIAFLSDEDVAGTDRAGAWDHLRRRYPVLAVTHAERGATLFERGQERRIGVFPATVVDPTGAGDVFVAGFLAGHLRGLDLAGCMRWGACLASFAVEAEGAAGLPGPEAFHERLQAHSGVTLR